MVGVGINLFGLTAGSNPKRSISQSPRSTRSLGLSLTDPPDIDRSCGPINLSAPKLTHAAADDPVSLYGRTDQVFHHPKQLEVEDDRKSKE